MQEHDRLFERCEVQLDGNQYVDCTFRTCSLVYRGGEMPVLVRCHLYGCRLRFTDAAARTVDFATELYHGGCQELVEATFDSIRRGPLKLPPGVH